jgi:hypothetical protein
MKMLTSWDSQSLISLKEVLSAALAKEAHKQLLEDPTMNFLNPRTRRKRRERQR